MTKQNVRDSLENGSLRQSLRRYQWSDQDVDYLIELAEIGLEAKRLKQAIKKINLLAGML